MYLHINDGSVILQQQFGLIVAVAF